MRRLVLAIKGQTVGLVLITAAYFVRFSLLKTHASWLGMCLLIASTFSWLGVDDFLFVFIVVC